MKKILLIVVLCFLLLCLPVNADDIMFNPSFLSAQSIVFDISSYWTANIHEIEHMMEEYPDFRCKTFQNPANDGLDQIICESVNNRYTPAIIVNFWFWGDHIGYTGLEEATFSVMTPTTKSVQEAMEWFWLENSYPYHNEREGFADHFQSLVFYRSNTIIHYDFPTFEEGADPYLTIDFRDIAVDRFAVG